MGVEGPITKIQIDSTGAVYNIYDENAVHTVKIINTDNSAAQDMSSSEKITGSGIINFHKVSKTGSYNDLLNKPNLNEYVTLGTDQEITGQKTTTRRLLYEPESDLPAGYSSATVVISQSGIDTGIAVSSLTIPTIETSFKMISVGDYDWFGTTNVFKATICANISSSGGTDYVRWGTTSSSSPKINFSLICDGAFHTLKIQSTSTTSHSFYVDGELIGTKTYEASFVNTGNIYIGRGRNTPASSWKYFKIMNTNANVVLFDGAACYDESSGQYGFYDAVSKTFKTASSGITGSIDRSEYALVSDIPEYEGSDGILISTSSLLENKKTISIKNLGVTDKKIASCNTNKLTQESDDILILDGGHAK